MDNRKIIICLITILYVFYSCIGPKDKKKSKDDFYNTTGGWGWIRTPILKPYFAEKIDPRAENSTWVIKFQGYLHEADNVESISVKDSFIYINCGDSNIYNSKYVENAWYVVDIRKNLETGFLNETEFNKYIKTNNIPTPTWKNIDSLSNLISHGKRLPWWPK